MKKALMATGALALFCGLVLCVLVSPPRKAAGQDENWLKSFTGLLRDKVDRADAIVVGDKVISLGAEGRVSLYHIRKVIKGGDLIEKVMAAYPEVAGGVMVAYDSPFSIGGHDEPRGTTLLFMTTPPAPGKNLHLMGNCVDQGMIYALPWVVDEVHSFMGGRDE